MPTTGPASGARGAVILMIGDGMGPNQVTAASMFGHGAPEDLTMHSLPHRGRLRTASLSGITDSAAAATAMATGVFTLNGYVGVDASGAPLETLVERARKQGLSVGLVTTAAVPHATPGGFSAHRVSRHDMVGAADDQAALLPDVLLGGGQAYFAPAGPGSVRHDEGLYGAFDDAGFQRIESAIQLEATGNASRVLGLFAREHMTYVLDRGESTAEPTLREMSRAALTILDKNPDGFFLLIEGARIDMAEHGNDLPRSVAETLAFDDAVAEVKAWAADRSDVTLIVTADHECGGIELLTPGAKDQLPDVAWRWGEHTNQEVDVFAYGPGTEGFADTVGDFRTVHAALLSRVTGQPAPDLSPIVLPDGHLADLDLLSTQTVSPSGFGLGFNQLDELYAKATPSVLAVGVEGLFEWNRNAVVVLIDTDPNSKAPPLATDHHGRVDHILSSLAQNAPEDGWFGADYALVSFGGADTRLHDLSPIGGLRRLENPSDLPWLHAALNFGRGARIAAGPGEVTSLEGFEAHIPWSELGLSSPAAVAISVVLVNSQGSFVSNQALPGFPAGTPNPGHAFKHPGWAFVVPGFQQ